MRVFHISLSRWILSDIKSPQVSSTLLCNLANVSVVYSPAYTSTKTCRINITQQWRTNEDFFKKYTSHFIWKGLCVRRSWRLNKDYNILTSPVLLDCCSTGNLIIRLFSAIIRTLVGEWAYPSEEVQSVYYTTSIDRASGHSLGGLFPLQRFSRCILQPLSTGQLVVVGLTSLQRCSRCILQPQSTGPRDSR